MTRPLAERSAHDRIGGLGHGVRQLERRPAPETPGKFEANIFTSDELVVTGDDAAGWFLVIPSDLDGYDLVHAHAGVYTPSSSGVVTVMYRNVTQAVDMLATAITIDANENTSYTAFTQPGISTTNAGVVTGDIIVVDVDTAGAGTAGLDAIMHFQRPPAE